MKLKVLIATLFVAGFASSFALAGGTKGAVDTTTGLTTTGLTTTGSTSTATGTTTTPSADKCKRVELKGSNGAGTVTFTVDKARKSSGLAGKAVTLTIPAGSRIHANACIDAAGALTLRNLEVSAAKKPEAPKPDADKGKGKDDKKSDKKGKKGD
jgi:hypothetical protein